MTGSGISYTYGCTNTFRGCRRGNARITQSCNVGIKNKPPAGRLQENGAACACSEVHVAFMVVLHGFLCHGTVNPGGLNALMPKEFLHLLNGHSGVKQVGGACPAEAVRVDG